jgi:hypothetical protein
LNRPSKKTIGQKNTSDPFDAKPANPELTRTWPGGSVRQGLLSSALAERRPASASAAAEQGEKVQAAVLKSRAQSGPRGQHCHMNSQPGQTRRNLGPTHVPAKLKLLPCWRPWNTGRAAEAIILPSASQQANLRRPHPNVGVTPKLTIIMDGRQPGAEMRNTTAISRTETMINHGTIRIPLQPPSAAGNLQACVLCISYESFRLLKFMHTLRRSLGESASIAIRQKNEASLITNRRCITIR